MRATPIEFIWWRQLELLLDKHFFLIRLHSHGIAHGPWDAWDIPKVNFRVFTKLGRHVGASWQGPAFFNTSLFRKTWILCFGVFVTPKTNCPFSTGELARVSGDKI